MVDACPPPLPPPQDAKVNSIAASKKLRAKSSLQEQGIASTFQNVIALRLLNLVQRPLKSRRATSQALTSGPMPSGASMLEP